MCLRHDVIMDCNHRKIFQWWVCLNNSMVIDILRTYYYTQNNSSAKAGSAFYPTIIKLAPNSAGVTNIILTLFPSPLVFCWYKNHTSGPGNIRCRVGIWYSQSVFVYSAQIKENIKVPCHWPLWGELTGHRWIPLTRGQQRGKYFHLMTSSWYT